MTTFNKREIELIDGLRNNWTAFAGLTKEQREVLKKAGRGHLTHLTDTGKFRACTCATSQIYGLAATYRPAPDFIPKPDQTAEIPTPTPRLTLARNAPSVQAIVGGFD